jgi:hypothetical protein
VSYSVAGSRVKGGPTLFVGLFIATLDAADGLPEWNPDEDRPQRGFVLIRISLPRLTKTRLLESCGGISSTIHLCGLEQQTMILRANSLS